MSMVVSHLGCSLHLNFTKLGKFTTTRHRKRKGHDPPRCRTLSDFSDMWIRFVQTPGYQEKTLICCANISNIHDGIMGWCMSECNMYMLVVKCIYIYNHMRSGHNYMLNLMPCTNQARPLSVVRISVFPEVSQMGYRCIGSSPIGYEVFVQPRKGQGEAKQNKYYNCWLVVWTPLKNISQLGWLFPIYGKIKMFQTTNQIVSVTHINRKTNFLGLDCDSGFHTETLGARTLRKQKFTKMTR